MAWRPDSRAKSARSQTSSSRSISDADLHQLSRNRTSVEDFTSTHKLHSRSEARVEVAVKEAGKVARKQAWAPPLRQSLSSSSSRFCREPTPSFPPHPATPQPSRGLTFPELTKAEDYISIGRLEKLREVFEKANREGNGKLDIEEFMRVCDDIFGLEGKGVNDIVIFTDMLCTQNEEQLRTFFKKIDNHSNGHIGWDEFCTYMYLEFQERHCAETRAKQVEFYLPAKVPNSSLHQEFVCAVSHLGDGSLVSCSEEGTICFWSPKLELKRSKQAEMGTRGKPKWISDMVLSLPHSKIILTTGDRELQFYEMANFEPYCQLKKLESIPLKLVCWHDPEREQKTIILVGDKDGSVTVMLTDNIQDAFKHWKLGPKSDGLPTYSLEKLVTNQESGVKCYRWKLHSNWVSELHYFAGLTSFASCSCDPNFSLIVGSPVPSTEVTSFQHSMRQISMASNKPRSTFPARRKTAHDQRVFRVSKGVSSVDYCPKNNVLITGSVDRIIRVWNPYMNMRPIGTLEGHTAPIFFVRADPLHSRIYSIGNDNTVMVWDTLEYTCLKSVIPSTHKFIQPTQAAHFNPISQQLVLATDQVAVLQLVIPPGLRQDIVQSHRNAISGVAYSMCFNHLITACRNGVVKVWDMTTGRNVFEFSVGTSGISTIGIDDSGKRLVTGSPDGQLKVWNYNSGECLKTLDKENTGEVTSAKFLSVNQNRYIVAVGWDRKVTVFPDVMDTIQEVQKPVVSWNTATSAVHKEDILTVAFGVPHLMATASFDGKIIVWSLVSYHVLNHLKAAYPNASHPPAKLEGDEAVQKLLFLNKRAKSKLAAGLVASGPAGFVHFWNVYHSQKPMARFHASDFNCVTSMSVDSDNLLLMTGDIEGFVSLWNIESYCVSTTTTYPPKRVTMWRAHTQRITWLELVEHWNGIVTASEDTSVRLWTLDGSYIGTFGQENHWRLGDPLSYQHPMGPRDILLETSSVPEVRKPEPTSPGVISRKTHPQAPLQVMELESGEEDSEDILQPYNVSLNVPSSSDESTPKSGKWLRHYRTQSAKYSTAHAQKVYRLLPYQSLNEVPDYQEANKIFAQNGIRQNRH